MCCDWLLVNITSCLPANSIQEVDIFCLLCTYKTTSGSLGERAMGSISTAFIDCCILT